MKKKGNKKIHTPRQKVIHNPIPASAYVLISHPYIFVMLKNVALFVRNVKLGKEKSTNTS